ncbi:MAG: hypothetical protein ACO20H_09755 [Bacteriovoracaceae bacterium]
MNFFLEGIAFLITHTPFWAVPLLFISANYGYIFWLKSYRDASYLFISIGFVCFLFIIYYVWHGGPVMAPRHFRMLLGLDH